MLPQTISSQAGPGVSSPVAPGAGKGASLAAGAQIKASIPLFIKALPAFPIGSKEFKAVQKVIKELSDTFGEETNQNLVPTAIQQLLLASRQGQQGQKPPIPPGMAGQPQPGAGTMPDKEPI